MRDFKVSDYDAEVLTSHKALADYFEKVVQLGATPKITANWILTELLRELNDRQLPIEENPLSAESFCELLSLIESNKISGKIAKT